MKHIFKVMGFDPIQGKAKFTLKKSLEEAQLALNEAVEDVANCECQYRGDDEEVYASWETYLDDCIKEIKQYGIKVEVVA